LIYNARAKWRGKIGERGVMIGWTGWRVKGTDRGFAEYGGGRNLLTLGNEFESGSKIIPNCNVFNIFFFSCLIYNFKFIN
jgi:hypothetical protein